MKIWIALVGSLFCGMALTPTSALTATVADHEHELLDNCPRPTPPAIIDGAGASQMQLDAVHDLVNAFQSDSNRYQSCVRRYVGQREDLAFSARTTVPKWVYALAQEKVDASQKDKQDVGQSYNSAVVAFRSAHP